MSFENVLSLIGGLALFLLGMDSMGDGLERACGNKMKKILEKLTSNRFVGVLVGMVITMVIQSSSATTVMVVGFVNAGMMTLNQAVWVIMGANIGTTITGQLVALDIGWIAPMFAIAGVVMMLFIKKPMVNEIGKIFCGFGVLFIGMDMMSTAMKPLAENEGFKSLMSSFSNPFLGILAGLVFTAVIQSSSASVGILQAMAISGVVTLDSAVYVLFGQNIGTCVTALLASLTANRCAKRTTMIHFMFNIIGTFIFTIICVTTPIEELVKKMSPDNVAQQIANMHTLFNITTTLLLLPLGTYLVKLAEKILPDKPDDSEKLFEYLDNDMNLNIGNSSLHLENLNSEIARMYKISYENVINGFNGILNDPEYDEQKLIDNEDLVDRLNEGITKRITEFLAQEQNASASNMYGTYLTLCNNIERISDHAMNMCEQVQELSSKNIVLNDQVKAEIKDMREVCITMFDLAKVKHSLDEVKEYENKIDDLTNVYRDNMLNRLKTSICTADGSIVYSTLLINFERIGDHLLNIAELYDAIQK